MLTALLTACASTPKVDTDYNQDFDFNQIDSFAFVAPDKPQAVSLNAQRVERAIEDQLLFMGYKQVDAKQADVLVSYYLIGKEKVDIETYDHGGFYRYGGYRRFHCLGCVHSTVRVSEYTEGTLVIELVDRNSEQVVWRTVTKERLKSQQSPGQRDAFVRERVALMFSNFPP
jgi:hypothetical protein